VEVVVLLLLLGCRYPPQKLVLPTFSRLRRLDHHRTSDSLPSVLQRPDCYGELLCQRACANNHSRQPRSNVITCGQHELKRWMLARTDGRTYRCGHLNRLVERNWPKLLLPCAWISTT